MRTLILVFLLSVGLLRAQAPLDSLLLLTPIASGGGGGFTGNLVDENCEGTGTPSGWTDSSSPNWDYTTTVLQGSQSLLCNSSSTYYTHSAQTTVEYYSLIRFLALPGSVSSVFSSRTSAGGSLAIFRVSNTGAVTVFANGSDSTACVNTMTTGVTYHVWLRYVSGGTCSVEFSTDGVRSGSGDGYTSKTGGTGNAERYQQDSIQHIADRLIADTGTIPSNP